MNYMASVFDQLKASIAIGFVIMQGFDYKEGIKQWLQNLKELTVKDFGAYSS